jgi:hypothetical protein
MKLWLISQSVNTDFDTYDAAVVAATTEEVAKAMHPAGELSEFLHDCWVRDSSQVQVRLIGDAVPGTESGVVLASFNAG